MSDQPGPWSHPPPKPRPPDRRLRTGLWLVLIAVVLAGVWGLSQLFPGRIASGGDQADLLRWLMLVTIVSAGLVRMRLRLNQALRYIAIWVGVIAVLVLGYSFRSELGEVLTRVRSEFAPGYPASTGTHEMVVTQDSDGGFYLIGQVNDVAVRFLADTGASDIVLSPQDAQRLGVDVAALKFTSPSQTANGIGHGAGYRAASLTIGSLHLTDVPMQINQAPMSSSLLGMAFFKRLESFQIRDGRLYLRWRG